ncbi:hypothetical protein NUW54_g6620 [Trametes sanguinea]|uniref:Uncharacterized protein n=1 Tax=Trametes sanguinea TaxID=158606 RepID=A0ACC1PS80_9APHY|nr:hypothetical protein NUW54_g6620 [Trametes sanguinea]
MPHTLFSLNYDVLSDILSHLSSRDATQLALASRAAYALALPRIVSDVTLGGLFHKPGDSAVSQLTAFCNFVLSPAPAWLGASEARLDALQACMSCATPCVCARTACGQSTLLPPLSSRQSSRGRAPSKLTRVGLEPAIDR